MHYLFRNKPHPNGAGGSKLDTRAHFDYISREGRYSQIRGREEDLVWKESGNLPYWAETAADYWQAVKEYKPDSARGYREFLLGLQEELSLEDNIACVEKFIKLSGIGEEHTYSYAIHDKEAAFDAQHRNIHCHLIFNEKILEKDRPLGPELHFKRYSVNENGEPTMGLKSSRKFISKAATYEMRKLWADIVNAKFKEKGLECTIDHRSLNDQKAELAERGKHDEAALLDRKPARHLGKSYRNPAVKKKIFEKIKEYEENVENGEITDDLEKIESEKEQLIAEFARDFVLRKIAKNLQRERLELLREEAENNNQKVDKQDRDEAYIVTTGNLLDCLDEMIEEQQQITDTALDNYKSKRRYTIPDEKEDERIHNMAVDLAFENKYKEARDSYRAVLGDISDAQKQLDEMKGIKITAANKKSYYDAIKKVNESYKKKKEVGKLIAYYKGKLDTVEVQERIKELEKILHATNSKNKDYNKELYRAYTKEKSKLRKYMKSYEKIEMMGEDVVVYADKVPPKMTVNVKLDGVNPVADNFSVSAHGEVYYAIDLSRDNTVIDKEINFKAVKLYDDITKGKLPVYAVTVRTGENGKPKIVKVEKTPELQNIYKRKERVIGNKASKQKVSSKNGSKGGDIEKKFRNWQLADNVVNDSMPRVDAYWNDKDNEIKDEAERAEEEMYRGWSL